jgi:hypothetical protein
MGRRLACRAVDESRAEGLSDLTSRIWTTGRWPISSASVSVHELIGKWAGWPIDVGPSGEIVRLRGRRARRRSARLREAGSAAPVADVFAAGSPPGAR